MAKRFTDTEIWKEDWFLDLPSKYIISFFYIKDNCNHVGIWKPNRKQLEFITGSQIDLAEFISILNSDKNRITVLPDGRWYLIDFIKFQYGTVLNENNRVHASIIKELTALNIDTSNFEVKKRSIRPQYNPNQGVKDKDKDKDIEKDKAIKGGMGENSYTPTPKVDWLAELEKSQEAIKATMIKLRPHNCTETEAKELREIFLADRKAEPDGNKPDVARYFNNWIGKSGKDILENIRRNPKRERQFEEKPQTEQKPVEVPKDVMDIFKDL